MRSQLDGCHFAIGAERWHVEVAQRWLFAASGKAFCPDIERDLLIGLVCVSGDQDPIASRFGNATRSKHAVWVTKVLVEHDGSIIELFPHFTQVRFGLAGFCVVSVDHMDGRRIGGLRDGRFQHQVGGIEVAFQVNHGNAK